MRIIQGVAVAPLDLAPLLRSQTQARLLARIFWDQPASGRELARRLGVPQATIAREVARLERSGIVRVEQVGRSKLVSPADTPITPALRQLAAWAAGAPLVVRNILDGVEGVDEAFIFGSWAARFHGEPGSAPRDIDVAVVSNTLTRFSLAEQRVAMEAQLGADVDLIVLPTDSERLPELRRGSVPILTGGSADA